MLFMKPFFYSQRAAKFFQLGGSLITDKVYLKREIGFVYC